MENKEDFGDFEEIVEPVLGKKPIEPIPEQQGGGRVRFPRKGEFIGIIVQRLGGNRMEIKCSDSKTRNCRVPGRFKRSMWLRPKDIVLIEIWEHDPDKGDVIYKYDSSSINQLRKRGMLNEVKAEF
jgi:translation initiation factor 1A